MFSMLKKKFSVFTICNLVILCILTLVSCSDPEVQLDFNKIPAEELSQYYLVCPPEYCNNEPHEISPVYSLSVENLDHHWKEVIGKNAETQTVAIDKYKYTYIMYGQYLGLPRTINVELIAINEHHSTLAISYKPKYGMIDLGDGRQIIQDLLNELQVSLSRHHVEEDKN